MNTWLAKLLQRQAADYARMSRNTDYGPDFRAYLQRCAAMYAAEARALLISQ